jgi:aryl-alcohol dehydrogenase
MEIKAAVVREARGPFKIEKLTLDEPRKGEILVRMVASGICHTDIIVRDQHYLPKVPVVLGHEGAGIVEKIGPDVSEVQPGDHVVLSFMTCGRCQSCIGGEPTSCDRMMELNFGGRASDGRVVIHDGQGPIASSFFGQSSFATWSLAHERNAVKVPKDIPLEILGPLGCGIQTGAGSAINGMKLSAGETIVVLGAGAVGLSAVMGAVIVGAGRIISVDLKKNRLDLARELGATDTIDASSANVVEEITRLTNGGARYILETSGNPASLKNGIASLRPGGTLGIVGAPPLGTEISVDVNHLLINRTVRGFIEGLSNPKIFIPRLIELYRHGRFPFDKLIKFYSLDDINRGVADSESGVTIKPVLKMA